MKSCNMAYFINRPLFFFFFGRKVHVDAGLKMDYHGVVKTKTICVYNLIYFC